VTPRYPDPQVLFAIQLFLAPRSVARKHPLQKALTNEAVLFARKILTTYGIDVSDISLPVQDQNPHRGFDKKGASPAVLCHPGQETSMPSHTVLDLHSCEP